MKHVFRRTPVPALLLTLALCLNGSAVARDSRTAQAKKSSQTASHPAAVPALRELPRQSANAEARLLEVYRLVGSAQTDVALTKAESLVRDVPNFQLAQLVYGALQARLQCRRLRWGRGFSG